jgi:hypothetical protein
LKKNDPKEHKVDFVLNENLYAEAIVEKNGTIGLWLGVCLLFRLV